MRRLVMACTVSQPPWRRRRRSRPRRHPVRTSCSLPSTRCAPTGRRLRLRTGANAHSGRARSVRSAVSGCTAHAPLTYPSHVSILTGRYPGALGVRLNGMDPLPDSASTVAERLKSAGYRTGAVIGSVVLDQSYGLGQGFDDYDDAIAAEPRATMAMADLQRTAGEVTAAAGAWIGRQRGPWFLWVHYYDPHLPYDAPTPFEARAPRQALRRGDRLRRCRAGKAAEAS